MPIGIQPRSSRCVRTDGSVSTIETRDSAWVRTNLTIRLPLREKAGGDTDGDEIHWKLEMTGANVGRLSWVGLPDGIKDVPVIVVKSERKNR